MYIICSSETPRLSYKICYVILSDAPNSYSEIEHKVLLQNKIPIVSGLNATGLLRMRPEVDGSSEINEREREKYTSIKYVKHKFRVLTEYRHIAIQASDSRH